MYIGNWLLLKVKATSDSVQAGPILVIVKHLSINYL